MTAVGPIASRDAAEEAVEKPIRLNDQRMTRVVETLQGLGAATVLDLGCGEGRLVRELLRHGQCGGLTPFAGGWLGSSSRGENHMFIDNGRAFTEARLLERLVAMFGDQDLGNGTQLANVVASAVAVDARFARATPAAAEALSDETLAEVACDLSEALLYGEDHTFELPFCTRAVSHVPGGIKIGDAHYVLDAGRPGLHPVEVTRQDAHGPNLVLLQRLIEKKTGKLACRRLGVPMASSIAVNDMRHNLQFPPCPEAGDVVLQRRACETGADRFCAATPQQLGAFADSIVRDMRELWKHRVAIGKRVEDVRRAVEAHLLDAHGPDGPVSIAAIAVELCGETGDQPVSLYVEMDSLDEALRPGRTFDYIPPCRPLEKDCIRVQDNYCWRKAHVAELAALGATGRISDLAAGAAASAPEGQATVLARLNQELETQVVIPWQDGELYATLFWHDGYIEAAVSMPGQLVTYSNTIELRATLPATMITAMVDRPLGNVVELPFRLPSPVKAVEQRSNGWLRVKVDYGHSLVNCATGAIWPEPSNTPPPEADIGTAR